MEDVKGLEQMPHEEAENAKGKNSYLSRLALNDNKAGMEGLDKDTINKIIYEASKGSKYFENERKKEEQVKKKIAEQKYKLDELSQEDLRRGEVEADKQLSSLSAHCDYSRSIVHIDMDAFYAAVETRDNPSLKDKPMAVGGNDMLSTSNYVARKYGVRAAMPGFIGRKLCPQLVIVPLNFEKYNAVSQQVRNILEDYDPGYCTMSLDEAYLDFTDHLNQREQLDVTERSFPDTDGSVELCACRKPEPCVGQQCSSCTKLVCDSPRIKVFGLEVEDAVKEMRHRIHLRTRLTASAGIAPNTMLAKICSDRNKPNGQFRVLPNEEEVRNFVENLPIRKVSGIGRVTEQMLSALGVNTCSDILKHREVLYHLYSDISFAHFLRVSQGIGSTTLQKDTQRKSISNERTFSEISAPNELFEKCSELCKALEDDLKQENLLGKTVTVKMKLVDFTVKTRASTLGFYTQSFDDIFKTAKAILLSEICNQSPEPLRLRLMGVRLSNLSSATQTENVKKPTTILDMFNKMSPKKPTTTVCENTASSEIRNTTKKLFEDTKGLKEENPIQISSEELHLSTAQEQTDETICPVCQEVIFIRNVHDMNQHVDDCLTKQETCEDFSCGFQNAAGNFTVPKTTSATSENSLNSVNEQDDDDCELMKSLAIQNKYVHCEGASVSGIPTNDLLNAGHGTDTSQRRTGTKSISSDIEPTKEEVAGSGCYTCPVCNCSLPESTLENFNKHVDSCLSRQAIKEIIKSQDKQHGISNVTTTKTSKSTAKGKKRRAGEGLQNLKDFCAKHSRSNNDPPN